MSELVLAVFIISVGLCFAACGTYLYQGLTRQEARLRYDGETFVAGFANLFFSFLCGPYIMLQLGWRQETNGAVSMTSVLLAAFVALGWSFITGLLLLGTYIAVFR